MESQFTQNPGTELQEVKKSIDQLKAINTRSSQYTRPRHLGNHKEITISKSSRTWRYYEHCTKTPTTTTLNNIFTACLRFSYFPKAWKNASIIMIPKPQKMHSIALRVITGTHYLTSNKTLLQTTNLTTLYEEAIKTTKIFFYKNSVSKYAHIRDIGTLPVEEKTKLRNRPFSLTI